MRAINVQAPSMGRRAQPVGENGAAADEGTQPEPFARESKHFTEVGGSLIL